MQQCNDLWKEQIIKPRCNKVEIRLYLYDMGLKLLKLVKCKCKLSIN